MRSKDHPMTQPALDDHLRALAAVVAERGPPASVDRAIAAAIASRARRPRQEQDSAHRWLAWPLALAASIFALSFVVRQSPPDNSLQPQALRAAAQAFVPVASAEEIARASDTYLLPARLPRMSLAQLGLPVDPQRIGEAVDAELLVRPDGAVLALRFVN
jgi:hypothetical protein